MRRTEGVKKGRPPHSAKGIGKALHGQKPNMADIIKGAAAKHRSK